MYACMQAGRQAIAAKAECGVRRWPHDGRMDGWMDELSELS